MQEIHYHAEAYSVKGYQDVLGFGALVWLQESRGCGDQPGEETAFDADCQYMQGGGSRIFNAANRGRMTDNGHKLRQDIFRVNIRKNIFLC